jgi:hypothetical protein
MEQYEQNLSDAIPWEHVRTRLEQVLMSSLKSGEPINVTPQLLEDVRRRLRARAKVRKSAKL